MGSDFTTIYEANHNNMVSFMFFKGRQWLWKQIASIISKKAVK